MEVLRVENLSFNYPGSAESALTDISFSLQAADFVVICGPSGCGKTTLVRNLKQEIAPHGKLAGKITYCGCQLNGRERALTAAEIGFVMQDPDTQIVTDTVWHELAFGLENMGLPPAVIRRRVAETAHFFGINTWFDKSVFSLSGGQKQVLNLASIMAMQPGMIILDEPTAQLDPVAAKEFLSVLKRIHLELGTNVIITEHLLDDVFPIADKVMYMNEGRIEFFGPVTDYVTKVVESREQSYLKALPSAVRIASGLNGQAPVPVTVSEGRTWLKQYIDRNKIEAAPQYSSPPQKPEVVLQARDIWFRYSPGDDFVLRGFSCDIAAGSILSIVGGNGSGKTTALNMLAGIGKPQRGKIRWQKQQGAGGEKVYSPRVALLAQNPKTMFMQDSVYADLMDTAEQIYGQEAANQVGKVASLLQIRRFYASHPYDLSGGEQQKVALAKMLLIGPQIMLLDEPTKGLDAYAKEELASIMRAHCRDGGSIVIVTHDVEFAARYSDACAMIFNGELTCSDEARAFFAGNTFYTTAANRISRGIIPDAVTCEDVIRACQKNAIES